MVGMGQIAIIRHLVNAEQQPIRAVARRLGLSRNTVRKYVREGRPAAVRTVGRRRPKMEVVGPRIEALLAEWSGRTTGKQRITGTRVHRALVAAGCEVGTTTVRTYLREKRRREAEVFVPLVHRAGEEAQVDFFEVAVDVGGERRTVHMLQFSLPCSDHDFAWLYEREDLPSFLDGHVRAFEHFGGVPHRLVYDNARVAVTRINGARRVVNRHFQRLVAHYAFEVDFARPYTGHDKGAIEVRGKRTRLAQLVPIPSGATLAEINEALGAQLAARAQRVRDVRGRTVAERLADERLRFMPLPAAAYEPRLPAKAAVTRQATIRLGGTYSVPSSWKGETVWAWVGATDVRIECKGEVVTSPRLRSGEKHIRYLHYLPELAVRPHAVRQVAPELIPELGEPWVTLWGLLVDVHGPLPAARIVSGLLAVRLRHQDALEAALAAALDAVVDGPDIVLPPERTDDPHHGIVRVPDGLADLHVEQAHALSYDALLVGGGR